MLFNLCKAYKNGWKTSIIEDKFDSTRNMYEGPGLQLDFLCLLCFYDTLFDPNV